MKRILVVMMGLALCNTMARGEDAATEERLNQLSGKIEDLIASQEAQRKRLSELAREIEGLRDQQSKPGTVYATPDDLKRLAESIKEVDRKRVDDNEKIHAEFVKLGKTLSAPLPPIKKSNALPTPKEASPERAEKGFDYVVQSGDTLAAIVQAYKEKNIKVTAAQIQKANPGLVPERMKVGQKIFIPAPQ
jgi:LysM repeat protein